MVHVYFYLSTFIWISTSTKFGACVSHSAKSIPRKTKVYKNKIVGMVPIKSYVKHLSFSKERDSTRTKIVCRSGGKNDIPVHRSPHNP